MFTALSLTTINKPISSNSETNARLRVVSYADTLDFQYDDLDVGEARDALLRGEEIGGPLGRMNINWFPERTISPFEKRCYQTKERYKAWSLDNQGLGVEEFVEDLTSQYDNDPILMYESLFPSMYVFPFKHDEFNSLIGKLLGTTSEILVGEVKHPIKPRTVIRRYTNGISSVVVEIDRRSKTLEVSYFPISTGILATRPYIIEAAVKSLTLDTLLQE